jgi:hypothetical protein
MNNVFLPCDNSTSFRVVDSLYGASGSHSLDIPHFVGPLWTSDQPDAESKIEMKTLIGVWVYLE